MTEAACAAAMGWPDVALRLGMGLIGTLGLIVIALGLLIGGRKS